MQISRGWSCIDDVQELNDDKETASNSMCMFLAINTSSVTLIASSVIAYRLSAGSKNPTEIIGPTIIATLASTIAAVIAAKTFEKLAKKKKSINTVKDNNREELA